MKTERFTWREPARVKVTDDYLQVEQNEYIEMLTLKAESALIEVSELDRIIPLVKRNFLKKLVRFTDRLSTLDDVKGFLNNELRNLENE